MLAVTPRHTVSRTVLLYALGLGLCLVSVPLACSFGALGLEAGDVLKALSAWITGAALPETISIVTPEGARQSVSGDILRSVVLDLRLPRVVLALLAGSGLAVAGAVFQAILRNPLADPFTLGVSGGAAFGAALAISLGFTSALWGYGLPLAALAGAGAALAAVLALGRIGGGLRHETLILAGVVVSAFLAALIALVKALDEASVTGIVFWIMGSFQGRGLRDLLLFLPGFGLGLALALALARELDMLSLGDRAARHLGLDTARLRLALLLGAGALTASCVAVSGIIGFVGLIVPHLVRMLLGASHARLLPVSALGGGLLLLWSDTAARTLLPGGIELPVGVITALLGGPFFCFILGKKRGTPLAGANKHGPQAAMAAAPETPGRPCPEAAIPESAAGMALNTLPDTASGKAQEPGLEKAALRGLEACCYKLTFTYSRKDATPALRDISFSLKPGEFVGLLGPNGSGKSTLLQCLSGLLTPLSGRVTVGGLDVAALSEKKRARLLAALPQRPESVPALSALYLALMGRYAHTPFLGAYSERDKAVTLAALALSGAGHLATRRADCLSGGELQRVLLARCLAQETGLLLLDEATAGLDPACCVQVLSALARRSREQGLTVLAAMHDLNLAALYCDRLILICEGRITADGPTQAVFTQDTLRRAFGPNLTLTRHPVLDRPQVLPLPQFR